jgi:Flp pilus assembly pilin Flp
MKKSSGIFSGRPFQNGQGLVEYGLLLALIAIGIVLIASLTGVSISDLYCRAANAISGGTACKGLATYCQDNFDGNTTGWQNVLYSNPTVQNGQMCLPNAMQALNICSTQMTQSDYVVNLNGVTLSSGPGYGVFFRSSLNSSKQMNGYALQYDPGLGNYLVIRRWGNGKEVNPPVAKVPINSTVYNVPHDIKIVAKGDTFTVFMDGVQMMTAQDSTYPSGGAGLRTWGSNTSACFNDFNIGQVP